MCPWACSSRACVERTPTLPEVHDTLAWVLYANGSFGESLAAS